MKLLRRILFILLIVVLSLALLLVIFISPIAKWAIEKYSVEYTGRQINMDKLTINLLTGSIYSDGLKIHEAKSSKLFFQCNELYANITVHKLLAHEYEFTEVKLDKPQLQIIQTGNRFNFSDLIDRFNKKSTEPDTSKQHVHWYINAVNINNAIIVYTNTSPYNSIKIQNANINIPGIAWNNKVYSINTDFAFASGGNVKAKLSFDKNSWVYGLLLDVKQFDIKPFYNYLKDYLKVNSLDGLITTQLKMTGDMHNAAAIALSGNIAVDNFSIIDNVNDKLTAIEKMEIKIDSLNTAKNIYRFASISLVKPYLKLEMYKDGYNFNRLSTSPASTADTSTTTYANVFVMMADYVQSIVSNYVVSNYNADKFSVEGGQFEFIDYTLYDKFRYNFDSLHLYSDRINSNSSKIYFDASAILNRSGMMKGKMDINPQDFKDFDIALAVKNLSISDFNPYSKYYVATPFLKGTIEYDDTTTVVKRQLKSANTLIVNQVIAGKKDKTNKPQYNMPVRLAVSLLRDVHGNINLKVPVTGSLDDPKFKMWRIIWQVLGNLIVKAASAPFHLLANAFGGKDEDYKEVDFNYLQTSVNENQQQQLNQLIKILKTKPDVKLELVQVSNKADEAEALAIFDVKKKYLHLQDSSTDLQQKINAVEINDSLFDKYVDSSLQTNSSFESVQEKCIKLIGKENLQAGIAQLMQQRINAVENYLSLQVDRSRLNIHNTDKDNDPNLGNAPKFVINIAEGADSTAVKME